MPTPLDLIFAVVVALLEAVYSDKRFKAAVAAGTPGARPREYRRIVIGLWAFAALAVLLWANQSRPWAQLGLVPPHDWRLAAGALVIALIVAFTVWQVRAIRRMSPARAVTLRAAAKDLAFMLPHTRGEYRGFLLVSVTAGVCEEILYRGFLTWLIAAYVGLPIGIAIAAVAFGCGHAYQGRKGMVKTGVVGLSLGLIVLATGWLIPAMIIHACLDVQSGELGYAVLGAPPTIALDAAA